jgi:mRNA interferase MazF
MAPRAYCPDRGDIVWLSMHPQAGHEQSGRRPALVLSPKAYNRKVGLALFCPLTSRVKRYPFEVPVSAQTGIEGVVLADQVRSMDWQARRAKRIAKAPPAVVAEVLGKLGTLLGM